MKRFRYNIPLIFVISIFVATHLFAATQEQFEKTFTATGSGSVVGIGVLENRYKPNMTIEEGIELLKAAISAARKRDTASGGDFQIATITKEGFKKLT